MPQINLACVENVGLKFQLLSATEGNHIKLLGQMMLQVFVESFRLKSRKTSSRHAAVKGVVILDCMNQEIIRRQAP